MQLTKFRSSAINLPQSMAAPQVGASTCARVAARTKFRGRAYYFFRDEALDANSWKNNTLGIKRLPLQQHDLDLRSAARSSSRTSIAEKKRTFFFTAYEYDTVSRIDADR